MYKDYGVSSTSVAVATAVLNPIDVVKVRLQLNTSGVASAQSGLLSSGYGIVRHEGPSALMSGVGPSVARGILYGGLRLGLYSPIKNFLSPDGTPSFFTKLTSGTLSGAVAAVISSPMELVKTRMQTGSNGPQSAAQVVRNILEHQGWLGLWKGSVPGMARASILTATQCATYDEVKRYVLAATGRGDNATTQLICSMITGLVSTTATNPVDVIKTHMFVGGARSTGVVACAKSLWEEGAARAFLKGWSANYARLGPQTVIIFLVNEQMRRVLNMEGL